MTEPTGSETTTVERAGRRLGIGRDLAYRLARTGSLAPGVPVIRIGRRLVVPTAALERALQGEARESEAVPIA